MKTIKLKLALNKKDTKTNYRKHLKPLIRLESYTPQELLSLSKHNLDRYYDIVGLNADQENALIAELKQDKLFDKEIEPTSVDPLPVQKQKAGNIYPSGTDLTHLQYLLEEPQPFGDNPYAIGGLNVKNAHAAYGDAAKGIDIQLAIIESTGSWYFTNESESTVHEDLPVPALSMHYNATAIHSSTHANEVTGIIYGTLDNGKGINGIAPYATPFALKNSADAAHEMLLMLSKFLNAGDIISLSIGVRKGPYENDELINNVMSYMIDELGIIFVEAAGNYNTNVDITLNNKDIGSIIVGALDPKTNDRFLGENENSASSYGSLVKLCGWGEYVPTTYHELNEDPSLLTYTDSFSYTSCATPQIAGCAAMIQGVLKNRGRDLLTSREMRQLLHDTGTVNLSENTSTPVGRMPNVLKALDSLFANK